MIPGLIFLIIFFSLVLIKSADMVIVAIRRISKTTHTGVFTLSVIILALGTSFPELFVGITSALENVPSVSLGDITGSNIANIALIGGLAAFFAGRVRVRGDYLRHEIWVALAASVVPLLLLLDGELNRVDGLILLAAYFANATSFFRSRFVKIGKEQQEEETFVYRFMRQFNHIAAKRRKELGKLFVGIALMLFSADSIVKIAVYLASLANMPEFVVGVVIIAIGTSLPELAFSFRSLEEHEPSMFFGNLLGSTIANSTLVVGVVSLIQPIHLVAVPQYFYAVTAFVVIFLVFWFFIRTKHRLDRWEAGILILMYLIFVVVELI
ncbi:sodium:calcium antiporter [Patescibacteria group bacterium]